MGFLRPDPHRAIVLLDYHLPADVAMRETVPELACPGTFHSTVAMT